MRQKKKALLVEDDRPAGFALMRALDRRGLEVIHVRKGEEALEAAAREKPDVILLDLKLAGTLDGLAVLAQLKAHPQLSTVPVLIVTNFGLPQDIEKGMAAGAAEYLLKSDHAVQEVAAKAETYANGPKVDGVDPG